MVERGDDRGGHLVEWPVDVRVVGGVCGVGAGEGWGAAVCRRPTPGPVEREHGPGGRGTSIAHFRVGVMRCIWGVGKRNWWGGVRRRVEEIGAPDVAGYDGNFVGVVEREVGVDEDEEVGNGLGEGERGLEQCPGVGVGVEDDGQERGGRFCGVGSAWNLKYELYLCECLYFETLA